MEFVQSPLMYILVLGIRFFLSYLFTLYVPSVLVDWVIETKLIRSKTLTPWPFVAVVSVADKVSLSGKTCSCEAVFFCRLVC